MGNRTTLLVTSLLLCTPLLSGDAQSTAPAVAVEHVSHGVLGFAARATVGDFQGETHVIRGTARRGGTVATATGYVETDARSLKTGNGMRDHDMYNALGASKYPVIRFELDSATSPTTGSDGVMHARLQGRLHVNGCAVPIDAPAEIQQWGDSTRVVTSFPISLAAVHAGGLSRFFGTLKVYDGVTVSADLTFVDGEAVSAEGH